MFDRGIIEVNGAMIGHHGPSKYHSCHGRHRSLRWFSNRGGLTVDGMGMNISGPPIPQSVGDHTWHTKPIPLFVFMCFFFKWTILFFGACETWLADRSTAFLFNVCQWGNQRTKGGIGQHAIIHCPLVISKIDIKKHMVYQGVF